MSLKSAEEWIGDLRGDGHTDLGLVAPENIRAIQADALRHAAELCVKTYSQPGWTGHYINAVNGCVNAIEAEAARLEKP